MKSLLWRETNAFLLTETLRVACFPKGTGDARGLATATLTPVSRLQKETNLGALVHHLQQRS
ncbi:hypothetical protein [uncultured Nostoc sp.]|uniref:hypothetical protein n=1 Tax=uncultured Nostoc sp. TaxID=340711 RepID=UPI0035C959E2